jgi:alkylation response protein AidB-like acyl-CoA dehydrogenase
VTTAPDLSVRAVPPETGGGRPEPAGPGAVAGIGEPDRPEHRELVARTAALARERFAPRADGYDRAAAFPREDFDDLHAAGLLAPTVPAEHGGLGVGPLHGSSFTLWMMTKQLARADLSLGRCWEGHANSLVLLDGIASDEQKARWFPGVVERGEIWVAWSGEPQAPKPGETSRFGTRVERVEGGWRLSGNKVFATSAGAARRAILLVHAAGPGGARHATAPAEGLLLLVCDLADPSVSVDGSWWDPIGMRATVSHLVRFDGTFIPDGDVLGTPGQYLLEGWQTRFIPHYAASFLGAAEAAYEHTREYLVSQRRAEDPYAQHRLARMAIAVETAHLWLRHVGGLWDSGARAEAETAGSRARWLIEQLATETVEHAVHACGARSLVRPSPIERILRDLSLYVRHDNDDQILATVGRDLLGLAHDRSFYKP